MTVSALENSGLETAWTQINTLIDWRRAHGHWASRRAAQARHWFGEEVRRGLLSVLDHDPARGIMASLGAEVANGDLTPEVAAARLLALLGRS